MSNIHSLTQLIKVILQWKEAHGFVLVFCYNRGGKFSLQILDDIRNEVEFLKKLTLEKFCDQGNLCNYELTLKLH